MKKLINAVRMNTAGATGTQNTVDFGKDEAFATMTRAKDRPVTASD